MLPRGHFKYLETALEHGTPCINFPAAPSGITARCLASPRSHANYFRHRAWHCARRGRFIARDRNPHFIASLWPLEEISNCCRFAPSRKEFTSATGLDFCSTKNFIQLCKSYAQNDLIPANVVNFTGATMGKLHPLRREKCLGTELLRRIVTGVGKGTVKEQSGEIPYRNRLCFYGNRIYSISRAMQKSPIVNDRTRNSLFPGAAPLTRNRERFLALAIEGSNCRDARRN